MKEEQTVFFFFLPSIPSTDKEQQDGPGRLKIGRRVNLRRRVITLKGALERGATGHGAASVRLALDGAAVVHQAVVFLLVLLAAPNAPGHQRQTAQDDGTADANHDADNRVAGLRGHAGFLSAFAIREARGFRRLGLARVRYRGTITTGASDDVGDNVGRGLAVR